MKLHLPIIIMALSAISCYAQADDRLVFELGDTDKTLADGAVWTASSATLTVNDVAAHNIGINDYSDFSISFKATANSIGTGRNAYNSLFRVYDRGIYYPNSTEAKYTNNQNAGWSSETVDYHLAYTKSGADNYGVDFSAGVTIDGAMAVIPSTTVEKNILDGEHTYTLVFSGSSVTAYVEYEGENRVLISEEVTAGVSIQEPIFKKCIAAYTIGTPDEERYAGFVIEFGYKGISNVSNIAFYNGDITKPIPEPATATLGLMALAGLVTRRRRK